MTKDTVQAQPTRLRGADSALDVMLTDATVGGPSRMLRPAMAANSRSAWLATRSGRLAE